MKLVGVKHTSREINDKDPKLRIGDIVRTSKYKNIFAKGYVPNSFEETVAIKKVKETVPRTCFISDLQVKEIVVTFYEK